MAGGALWSESERETLRRLYPSASQADVLAALPGRTWESVGRRAARMGVKRLYGAMGHEPSVAAATTVPSAQQIEALRKTVSEQAARERALAQQLGQLRENSEAVAAAASELKLSPMPGRPRSGRGLARRSEIDAVMDLGDWHIGEVVLPDETGGFGGFDWTVAQARVAHLVDSFLKYNDCLRQAYRINRLHVRVLGDLISGDIHEELRRYAEFPSPVQTAKSGFLLAEHRGENNFMYLAAVLAETMLERCRNVTVTLHRDIRPLVQVGQTRWLLEHGNDTRAWMGIPYYGIQRSRGREAMRRVGSRGAEALGFDFRAMGHWHVPGVIEGREYVNGSLSGTTEFDHAAGRHAPPSQCSYYVGRHGPFNWTAWDLSGGPSCLKS